MTTIASENWDGVTAPAIPAGWVADSPYWRTATGQNPTSSPNSLVYLAANADNGAVPYTSYTSPDTNNGDVQVSTNIYLSPTSTNTQNVILYARSPIQLTYTADVSKSCYTVEVLRGTGTTAAICKYVSGVRTVLGTVSIALADNTGYRLFLHLNGTAIAGQCQRLTDNLWLNSSGTFVADAGGTTVFASATDSALSGAGYMGIGAYLIPGGGTISTDNFLLETYPPAVAPPADTVPAVKVFYGGMPQ